jgi:hypothetical protein
VEHCFPLVPLWKSLLALGRLPIDGIAIVQLVGDVAVGALSLFSLFYSGNSKNRKPGY